MIHFDPRSNHTMSSDIQRSILPIPIGYSPA